MQQRCSSAWSRNIGKRLRAGTPPHLSSRLAPCTWHCRETSQQQLAAPHCRQQPVQLSLEVHISCHSPPTLTQHSSGPTCLLLPRCCCIHSQRRSAAATRLASCRQHYKPALGCCKQSLSLGGSFRDDRRAHYQHVIPLRRLCKHAVALHQVGAGARAETAAARGNCRLLVCCQSSVQPARHAAVGGTSSGRASAQHSDLHQYEAAQKVSGCS